MSRHLLRPKEKRNIHARARRPTAILPTAITGLQLWLDLTDLTKLWQDSAGATPVAANNDPIGKILDKSANALSFTQATAGSKPLYQSNGFGGLFDGSDDCLTGLTTGVGNTKTILVAHKIVSFGAATKVLFSHRSVESAILWYVGHGSTGAQYSSYRDTSNTQNDSVTSNGVFTTGIHAVSTWIWNDTADPSVPITSRTNGLRRKLQDFNTGYSARVPTIATIGAANTVLFGNANIRHVLIYNSVLTPAQIGGLETYLAI